MTLYTRHTLPSGRHRYAEYGTLATTDALPHGYHLVHVAYGGRTTVYQIDPDHAGLLAAAEEHRDATVTAIQEAMAAHAPEPLTPSQARAWEALQRTGMRLVIHGAARVYEKFVAALVGEVRP